MRSSTIWSSSAAHRQGSVQPFPPLHRDRLLRALPRPSRPRASARNQLGNRNNLVSGCATVADKNDVADVDQGPAWVGAFQGASAGRTLDTPTIVFVALHRTETLAPRHTPKFCRSYKSNQQFLVPHNAIILTAIPLRFLGLHLPVPLGRPLILFSLLRSLHPKRRNTDQHGPILSTGDLTCKSEEVLRLAAIVVRIHKPDPWIGAREPNKR